jgi:signal transduction histidine kinase
MLSARRGPPIAVQIIALLVAVLIIGQLATLAVVVILPPPRPPVYRIEEIAAALKTGRVLPRYAPTLVRAPTTAPPTERSDDLHAAMLKAELARNLGVGVDAVRLTVERPPRYAFPFNGEPRMHRRDRFGDHINDSGQRPDRQDAPATRPPASRGPAPAPGLTPAQEQGAPGAANVGPAPGPPPDRWVVGGFHSYLHGLAFWAPPDRMGVVVGQMQAAYAEAPGRWFVVRSPSEGFPNAWQRRLLLWFLACLAILTPVGYLFARRLSAPIGRFASAAERLGRDPNAPPLALGGPAEISLAAAAFNEMQARLARYVHDRTAMLAAIAHDLRTPLARVQFKLNRAAPDLAADIRSDLGQMEAMIAAVLGFVRDAAPAHERAPLDLLSVLEVVADDACDTGADVAVEPGPSLIVEGDASALQRLFTNLVDNAVKYGAKARMRLTAEGAEAVVEVQDAGPGLSQDEIEKVFEPFYRIESSRNRQTGGIGLGLAVARSVARAHGGDVTLTSNDGGLLATVRLPGARALP